MLNISKNIIISVAFTVILALTGCQNFTTISQKNQRFEIQLEQVLNLTLVNQSKLNRDVRIRVFNDTLVGYHPGNNADSCFYFIRGLIGNQNIIKIGVKQLVQQCQFCAFSPDEITFIDDFHNGCVFSGAYGQSYIVKVCVDGTIEELFKKYNAFLFYANKVLVYGNNAIVSSYNGIYIFDLRSQNLRWQYRFPLDYYSPITLIQSRLFFSYRERDIMNQYQSTVVSLDLNQLKICWKKTLLTANIGTYSGIGRANLDFTHNQDKIIITTSDSLYVVDSKSGLIRWSYNSNSVHSMINQQMLFLSNKRHLLCYGLNDFKKMWDINNAEFEGLHNSEIIAMTNDKKQYLIIDSRTGNIKAKVDRPDVSKNDLIVIGPYVMLSNQKLYR